MIKNFAELQERVRSSEPLVVSVAQAADQEVLLSVKAAADQGFIKPVLTGDRERIEELCGRIGLKPLEILQAGTEEEAVERAVRAVHDGSAQVLMKGLVNTSVYMLSLIHIFPEQKFRVRLQRGNRIFCHSGHHVADAEAGHQGRLRRRENHGIKGKRYPETRFVLWRKCNCRPDVYKRQQQAV